MSPVQLEVLLHFYYTKGAVGNGAPAWTQAVTSLTSVGLLMRQSAEKWDVTITDKGRAHVKALLALPLPVLRSVWVTESARMEDLVTE